jgi:hypothetical protein
MQLFDTSSRRKIDLTDSAWSDAGQTGQYSDSGAGAYLVPATVATVQLYGNSARREVDRIRRLAPLQGNTGSRRGDSWFQLVATAVARSCADHVVLFICIGY